MLTPGGFLSLAKVTMDLSVIIPAFNEARYLPGTLESTQRASEHLRSKAEVDLEVIVVDNNSTDETAMVAGEWVRP